MFYPIKFSINYNSKDNLNSPRKCGCKEKNREQEIVDGNILKISTKAVFVKYYRAGYIFFPFLLYSRLLLVIFNPRARRSMNLKERINTFY